MAEQALYRKYRSADFSQVLGQEHVVATLTAAIASGRLSHAYLFTGPRGVGKTSVARLLARALNCTGKAKPCNECANCKAIINSSLDVVEIDAASNRSIDSVRDLREKVALAPALGKHKVYIIDEVHMLTSEAFNALLKTLEEPPAHAVFILATTEAHKVPETIISRTQRFSFKPIGVGEMVAHLAEIASAEQAEVTPEALELLAIGARGSFRDAISALDQVLAGGERPVTAEVVQRLLGIGDGQAVAAISRALATGDARAALVALAEAEAAGAQASQLAGALTAQWREVMLVGTGAAAASSELVDELAAAVPPARAATIVSGLLEAARSPQLREALEVALVLLTAAPTGTVLAAPAGQAAATAVGASAVAQNARPEAPAKAATGKVAKSATKPAAAEAAAPIPEPADALTDTARWPKVIMLVKGQNNGLAAVLAMYPTDVTDNQIVIKVRYNFHRELFHKSANRQLIETVAGKVYGRALAVTAVIDESATKAAATVKVDPSAELISSALEILGGEVVD